MVSLKSETFKFYAIMNSVECLNSKMMEIEAESPELALEIVKSIIASGWMGGIEICDSSTLSPDSMPLIDCWFEK